DHRGVVPEEEVLGADRFAVILRVRVLLGSETRALERDAGEKALRFGVRVDLRVELEVGARLPAPTQGPGRDADLSTQGELAAGDQRARAPLGHEEENEVGFLSADLQAPASPLERHENRRAPAALTVPAAHHAFPPPGAKTEGALDHARDHDDALAVFLKLLGHAPVRR